MMKTYKAKDSMITRVQNKRRSSYSYANDVMTPSRRNINRLAADDEEEMIVKNNNIPSTPVRVATSAATSNDEMKEPAAITSTSSSSTNNNIGPNTPGRMMAELSNRIRSFHSSTSRNEDSRDDDIHNNNSSEDYEIHYQYSTDPSDIHQRNHDDSSDDDVLVEQDDTKSKGEHILSTNSTVSNKKNNFNNNKSNSSNNNNTAHHRQRYFIEDEIKRFELFRTVIQHEDDLLNQRVSWIILAQSFLMAAVFTSEKGDFGEESNGLKYITAGLGITTIIITMPSILAAGRNIELQQRVYFRGISSESRCYELHGHGRDHHKIQDGELEKRYRYGHVFPNMAFRGKGALPILNVVLMLAVAQICGWVLFLLAIIYGW
jgi:hypothetical protein